MAKMSVNNSSRNSKITMPQPMNNEKEAGLSLRRTEWEAIHKDVHTQTTKDGKQQTNFDLSEEKGYKKLKKGQKEGLYMVGQTDKSNKLVVCDMESYGSMGEVHTSKDRQVHMADVETMAKKHDYHMSMIIKVLKLGDSHGHRGRFRESYMGGKNPSTMYLAFKDHKPKDKNGLYKTRPIVAANTSYNVGLRETCSVILESIYQSREDKT